MVSNNIYSNKKFILLVFILLFALFLFPACKQQNGQEKEIVDLFKQIKKENDIYFPKNKTELELLVKINNIKLSTINVKDITDMSELFKDSQRNSFEGIDSWDTSNVKNMKEMFKNASNFMGGISNWNVSNVENMEGMFEGTVYFNDDLSSWDTSKVKNMKGMFSKSKFNGDISTWNTSNVDFMSDMFNLYKYENMLYVMLLSGKEIKNFLEMSYSIWTNVMTSADDRLMLLNDHDNGFGRFRNPTFNFDSAAGIVYTVDVTKPQGEKINIISINK